MHRPARSVALTLAVATLCAPALAAPARKDIDLVRRATATTGGAEIVAFDPGTARLFVMNAAEVTVDVFAVGADGSLTPAGTIDASAAGAGANSIAVHGGRLAVAVEAAPKTAPGRVLFYDAGTLALLGSVGVGALPDMVEYTPNGQYLLVANEAEPSADYGVDPEGSVSIVDLRSGVAGASVRSVGFAAAALPDAAVCAGGVRIFGAYGAGAAQDLEPEYIAADNDRAYVTLQENNALAVISIRDARLESVRGLGCKDHSLAGAALDASDRDGGINIRQWPVRGLFQPDAIDLLRYRSRDYLITANEGDARVYPDPCGGGGQPACVLNEEVRVGSAGYVLDPARFPDAAALKNAARLGRLTVTSRSGDLDGDGDFDEIHAFGARSFSIWDAATGELVWDSGDDLEQFTAAAVPTRFNSNGGADTFDTRSDNKGPEPEGVVVGKAFGRDYAFVALERTGGVAVYDVSNPLDPRFVEYEPYDANGDRGPEGLAYVAAEASPTGRPLLIVGNEVSGTATLYEVVKPGH